MTIRALFLCFFMGGCAYISDEHEAWRLDPDGDGVGIDDDCDENDPNIGAPQAWYVDQDEDGFGDDADLSYACTQPVGHVLEAGDCDDTDGDIRPGISERCDGIDNNCDGAIDEDLPVKTLYADVDGDGFGNPEVIIEACGEKAGMVDDNGDCDDGDPFVHAQGPAEIPYNGIDDNCDFSDGDGDADGDGYWAADYQALVAANGAQAAMVPEDFGDDCDDRDEAVYPGAEDVWYDGVDSDCGGEDDCDIDGDGFQAAQGVCVPERPDCDDHAPAINPDAVERCATVGDDNCDGDTVGLDAPDCTVFFLDLDGDGFGLDDSICQCEGAFPHDATVAGDCDDNDAFTFPGAFESPMYDGIDRDCAGDDDFDVDKDGYVQDVHVGLETAGVSGSGGLPGGDCADTDPLRNPGVTEDCTTLYDDDCDGQLDSEGALGCGLVYPDGDGDGFGEDSAVACWCDVSAAYPVTTGGDCVGSDLNYYPGAPDPPYDFEDTDCAGDDDFDADGDGHSDAAYGAESLTFWVIDGEWEAVAGALDGRLSTEDCDDSTADIHPGALERCATVYDDNCDGETTGIDAVDCTVFFEDGDGDGFGLVGESICQCEGAGDFSAVVAGDCDDGESSVYPDAEESCDAVDQDCDGDLVGEFGDLDGDGDPDCIDPVLVSELASVQLNGPVGSDAGESVLIGADGALYIGAPGADRVYVLEDFGTGEVDLEAEAVVLDGIGMALFGHALAEVSTEAGEILYVGAPGGNMVARITDPLSGGRMLGAPGVSLSYGTSPGDPTPTMCGAALTVGEFAEDPMVVVGCAAQVHGGYVLLDSALATDGTFLGLGGLSLGAGVVDNVRFSWSMDTADLNGDGVDDVVVGAPRDDLGCAGSDCGSVFVYYGPFDTTRSYFESDAHMVGARASAALGEHVLVAPDLDGDGAPDLLLTTDQGWSEVTAPGDGAVLLVSSADLAAEMVEGDAFSILMGDSPWSRFGHDIDTVDVDSDGAIDVVVSAYTVGGAGAVYGAYGPFDPGTRVVADSAGTVFGLSGDDLGYRLVVGDVGGDGEIDVVISAAGNDRVWILDAAALFYE